MEAGRLSEIFIESDKTEQLMGNVYRGRVVDVLPSMQAAFIDIGLEKNAFLYIDDALAPDWQQGARDAAKPNIRELVRKGEELLVQINKEATGTKAPRVTTQIGLPGRILVYMPQSRQVSVSRKIGQEQERRRLQQLATSLLTPGEGVILRTLAEGVEAKRIENELRYLRTVWQEALNEAKSAKPPSLVYQDADLVIRTVRDTLAEDVEELVVDHPAAFARVKQLVTALYPGWLNRLSFYQGKQPLFEVHGVEHEIDKALRRQVWLKSGGYLVIDHTEAMTVIDVNTGKFTGKSAQQLEETVTQTNLEAAREIARQLRLRDIGGIIIIDFIDMKSKSNQTKVLAALQEALAHDRTSTYVLGMTQLGLVEMTRKKSRQSLTESLTRPCPVCEGKGRVLSETEAALRFEREIRSYVKNSEVEAIVASLPENAAALLDGAEADRLQKELDIQLYLLAEERLHPGESRILYVGNREEAKRRYDSLAKSLEGSALRHSKLE